MNAIQPGPLFAFAFSVTLPIFAVVAAGAVLRHVGIVSDEFIRSASSLVFNIGLPVTPFVNAAGADFSHLESGMELAILFLLAASPTAAASFIMARAMGGNAALSANIIALSTLGAVITVTGGLMLLKLIQLI